MNIYWQSPRFFNRPGVFLKIGNRRMRVVPVPRWLVL